MPDLLFRKDRLDCWKWAGWQQNIRSQNHIKTFCMFLFVCVTWNQSNAADEAPVYSFKTLLSTNIQISKVVWEETVFKEDSQSVSRFIGATDGTNYFIRQYSTNENTSLLLSPTNKLGIPYFVGYVNGTNWEIAGGLMINESDKTNIPIAGLVKNGRILFSRCLTFGVLNVKAGGFVWDGNRFSVPRFGIIPTSFTIISHTTNRLLLGTNIAVPLGKGGASKLSLTNTFGEIHLSQNHVSSLDYGGSTIYYDYTNSLLPPGVPSDIIMCSYGQQKSNPNRKISILEFNLATNLSPDRFEPTTFIAAGYFGITQVYSNKTQIQIDNAYATSETLANELPKRKRLMLFIAFLLLTAAPVFLFIKNAKNWTVKGSWSDVQVENI